jgi:vancomycin resistance protein YoaR
MDKIKNQAQIGRIVGFFGLGFVVGLIVLVTIARLSWHGKFYPGVSIAHVAIGGLTREEARQKLQNASENYQITITFNGASWSSPKGTLVANIDGSLDQAYRYGRRLEVGDYLFLLINKKTDYPLLADSLATDTKLRSMWATVWSAIEIPPVEPLVELKKNQVTVESGSLGVGVDQDELFAAIDRHSSSLDTDPIEVPTKSAGTQPTSNQLEELRSRAEKLLPDKLNLIIDQQKITLSGSELVALLSTSGNENPVDVAATQQYVQGVAKSLNRDPGDAKFVFENNRVKEFAPGTDGVEVQVDSTTTEVIAAVTKLLTEDTKTEDVQIVATKTPPAITTDKVNNLGIRELIGRGESYYAHSIPNRIFNVGLTASKIDSVLVAPGQEFSFIKSVGDISASSGFKQAYVISNGRTELGDGGGVCQVSTTVFRAATAAGLPITERWAHAYRVGYYEQNSKPGIDATIFEPGKDFKFKNDTPGYILVQTINDPKTLHLIVDIYGTSDGRVATVSTPKVWGITPPPPDIIQDDPTLRVGTTKQVDWSAWGAKTSFVYMVTRNGETLQSVKFNSNYKPWANIYLKGTAQ